MSDKDMKIDEEVDLQVAFRFTINKDDVTKLLKHLHGKEFISVISSFSDVKFPGVEIKQREWLTRFRESKKFNIIPLEEDNE